MKTLQQILSRVMMPVLILVICSISCDDQIANIDGVDYKYAVPSKTDDGWEVASLSEVEMDETAITRFINDLVNDIEHKIHSILIVKDSKLAFEEYFPGYAFYLGSLTDFNLETAHNIASVTKSLTSALIGLTIDHGYIPDVDQKIVSFFSEYHEQDIGEKDEITLEHLLTMTSGLEWDESTYPYTDSRNYANQLSHKSDPIRFILSRPILTEPGTQFLYSSGSSNILGEIIRRATGLRADDFAREYLFSPLGISDFSWNELSNDVLYTSGDLKLRPRDMAKLGEVYLQNGRWNGQQIISEQWVEKSTVAHICATSDLGIDYGYNWWLYTYEVNLEQIESFSASGWGGQNIIVFPSLDMVVITTAGYYDEPQLEFHIDVLLMQKILDSVLLNFNG